MEYHIGSRPWLISLSIRLAIALARYCAVPQAAHSNHEQSKAAATTRRRLLLEITNHATNLVLAFAFSFPNNPWTPSPLRVGLAGTANAIIGLYDRFTSSA